jgi:outer membrane receptor protein involved in Fe transport
MICGLKSVRWRLATGTAIVALSTGAAMAQQGVEQVTITSTRLQAAGFDAPTPTTVLSATDLQAQAKPNIFDTLTIMPAVQGSTGAAAQAGTTSNGLIGLSAIGLRALSPLRTLVLLDNQRYVAANENGTVDVSGMPQMLIQRVDIVTGGASAAWGSDAVAGVVNFVTDKKFEGFKMNAQAGLSTYGDMGNVTYQAAAGTSFAGGRGHFETAVEYSYNDGLLPRYPQSQQHAPLPGNIDGRNLSRTSGTASYGGIPAQTPAGQPQSYYGPLVQQTQFAAYGLVQKGPKAFMTFGSNGIAYPYAIAGSCSVTPAGALVGSIAGNCFGTPSQPGDQADNHEFTQGLINPLTRGSVYMRASYDLSPHAEVYATLTYSGVRTENTPAQGNSDKSGFIHCDNAYLPSTNLFGVGLTPQQTLAACLAAYPTPAGKNIYDNGVGIPFGSRWANILTDQNMHIYRQTRRFVFGGDGDFDVFGKNWTWASYYEHGENDTSVKIYNMPLSNTPVDPATGSPDNSLLSRFNLAQDAVVNAAGNIVCRNTIAQTYGCAPFSPFGNSPINQGSQAYFDNQQVPAGQLQHISSIQTNRQESFDFSVNGSPIDDWAGPVAVAFGYAYREEHYSQRADPYASGVTASTPPTVNEPCTDPFIDCGLTTWGPLGAYNAGNYKNGYGTYHVNEVFVEFGVPLLNDSFWGKADLDVAGRHARYSTAGDANTWKVGLTWDTPVPGIRLRALQSRDIRAPNLSELEPPPVGANGSFNNDFVIAPATDNGHNLIGVTAGNIHLKPERAYTTEVGIVWQPDFIPGFQASVDYYRIGLAKVIYSYGTQNIEDLCFLQFTNAIAYNNYCAQTAIKTANGQPQTQTLGSQGLVSDPNNVIQIIAQPFNAASMTTDGFDIEASYSFDLQDYSVPGNFTLRSLINHTSKFIFNSAIPGTQQQQELTGAVNAGNNGQTYTQFGGDLLNYKITETQSYQNDIWGIDLTERWLSPGVSTVNRNYLVCNPGSCPAPTIQVPTINFNKVDSMFYFDVGLTWYYSPQTQFYTKVENLTNIRPPDIGTQDNNQVLYDVIGRMFRVGVRLNY